MNTPRDILVIKPSSLGDVVHALPAVALVKKAWPKARLRWLINPEWAPLLAGNPHVDEVVIFPRGEFRGLRGLARIPAWAKAMAEQKSDLVLDFQGLLRSALIAKLIRAAGGKILGLADAREGARFFYDFAADVRGVAHAVDRYAILADLAIDDTDLLRRDKSYSLEWTLPQGSAPTNFAYAAPFILLHPFSRGTGKSLTPNDVATFCREVAPRRVVLAGRTDQQVAPLDNVTALLNRTTIPELIWLIRHAAFVVSVDSGPMHIAAALTPRLLSMHTWSDPRKVGPYRPEAWVWKDAALFQMKHVADPGMHRRAASLAEVARHVAAQLGA